MTPEEAAAKCRTAFPETGDTIKDFELDERGGGLAETVWHDLRFGIRQFRKEPRFHKPLRCSHWRWG